MYIKNLVLLAMGYFLMSCQSLPYQPYARPVSVKPKKEGTIALKAKFRQEDRAMAESMMSKNCPNGKFEVIEEGEVVTGTKTNSNTSYNQGKRSTSVGSFMGLPIVSGARGPGQSGSSSTHNTKEWQIKYKCLRVASRQKKRKSKVR